MSVKTDEKMDDCETYNCSQSIQETSSYVTNYDNEEFYPDEKTPEESQIMGNDPNDPDQEETEEYYNHLDDVDFQMDQEEQKKLEKTIFHKAMIGIGPYLVQKAASVLGASSSYSGDLSYLPKAFGQLTVNSNQVDYLNNSNIISEEKELAEKRKFKYGQDFKKKINNFESNRPHSHSQIQATNSQSFTKGFQKLRIGGGQGGRSSHIRPIHSRGSTTHFKFQRGHNNQGVNNKCSSTSLSVGRGWKQQQQNKIQTENSIGQRLASARKMQIKELKSRITQLENQLKESRKETQTLNRMQHRYEVALMKYEGKEAELPKMIRSHVAEVRSLQENLRKSQNQNRNVDEKLKLRDQKIFRLEEENKTLIAFVKQNNLEERSKLTEQLDQARIDQKNLDMKVSDLQRHVEILEKNHRHQISVETKKLRATNNKLFEAHQEIDKLVMALKEKDRNLTCMRIRQGQVQTGMNLRCDNMRMPIFRDDLSVRSARTLPLNKNRHMRPTDQGTTSPSHEQNLRRQRSETCGPHNRKIRSKFSSMNSAYFYDSNEDHVYDESYIHQDCYIHQGDSTHGDSLPVNNCDIINPRHNNGGTQSMSMNYPHQRQHPLSPRSAGSFQQSCHPHDDELGIQQVSDRQHHDDLGSTSMTPTSQRILTDQSESNYQTNLHAHNEDDDEYFNFENVSVEDDTNYKPHKSLFMDAIDSSCNVSSMGQSPLDSMRRDSNQNNQLYFTTSKNLRPSSAGPKFRLPKKETPQQQMVEKNYGQCVQHSRQSDGSEMISGIQCPSALQSPSIGDVNTEEFGDGENGSPLKPNKIAPLINHNHGAGAGDGPSFDSSTDEIDPDFASQRPSKDQMDEEDEILSNEQSKRSSSSSDDSDQLEITSQNSNGDSEKFVASPIAKNINPKSKSEAHLSPQSKIEGSSQNVPVIEAMFSRWKKNKRNAFQSTQENEQESDHIKNQEETTPRRKEALLQKLKEMDATDKKSDEKVSLSNPAYFSTKLESKTFDNHEIVGKPSSQLFKPSLYQPFFNTSNSPGTNPTVETIIPVQIETPSGRKVKNNPLPWLNVSNSSTTTSSDMTSNDMKGDNCESDKSGLRLQYSSILEPRHTLPLVVSSPKDSSRKCSIDSSADGITKNGGDNYQDISRKKFSVGTILSLGQGNVQSSTSLTCTKRGNGGGGGGLKGSSPSWK